MVSPYLKNKGSAVRFCLWPQMNYKPLPNYLTIKVSSIEGLGLFSTSKILKGTYIGITHIYDDNFKDNYIRTPLGGFINHSEEPNCELRESEEAYLKLYATLNINAGQELTLKYKMYSV